MRLTIRASERKAILDALEADYKSDKDAADTIIKLVVELLSERDAYGLKVPLGPTMAVAIGPFFHSGQIKAVSVMMPGSTVHPLSSPARFLELLDPNTHRMETMCDSCRHPKFAHGFSGKTCVVPKCRCKRGPS